MRLAAKAPTRRRPLSSTLGITKFAMFGLPSSATIEFAGFVLMHCAALADANREGELICPFAVVAEGKDRRVIDFESETQEEAVAKGWASLADSRSRQECWAFGREGLYREGQQTTDVLIVSAWTPTMPEPASLMQRFARGPKQELYLIGPTDLLLHAPNGTVRQEEWDRDSLSGGIASHPRGQLWNSFQPQ